MSADRSGIHIVSDGQGVTGGVYYSEGFAVEGRKSRTGEYKTLEHGFMGLKRTLENGFDHSTLHDKSTGLHIALMYRDPGSPVYYIRIDFSNLETIIRLRALR